MVHTAELTYFPNAELIKAFKELQGTVFFKQDNVLYNGTLKENGLQFRLKIVGRNGFLTPRLICRINFKKVIKPTLDAKVEILTPWECDELEQCFNALTSSLCPSMPPFSEWWVNRIDYCVNVRTPYVEEYISLLKKGDRPFLRDWYDRQGNYSQKQGSLYLVSTAKHKRNRSTTINFYNKQDEITKDLGFDDEDWDMTEELLDLAQDILRLEVQCHKVKTESIKKSWKMDNKKITNFLNPLIAEEILGHYLIKIAGTGDYLRKPVALQKIEETNCKRSTKDKMKMIIQDIAKQHSSVSKVRQKYLEEGIMQQDEYNRLIKSLHNHGINPVTIRSNQKLDHKTLKEGLTNIYPLFTNALQEELKQNN